MKNLKYSFVVFITAFLFFSCENSRPKEQPKEEEIEKDDRSKIEKAHKKAAFLEQKAVQFRIKLSFGGKERLNGKLTLATNSTSGKIEYENGNILLYNEQGIFHSDSMGSDRKLRFAAYTWSYFFLLPYKLNDPGANWKPLDIPSLRDSKQNVYHLSFDAGIGDAPDDWYKIYADQKSNLIDVASYIVTANKTAEEAEEDPHAIEYSNYQTIAGIPIAQNWKFWGWKADSGLTKQLGKALLANMKFVDVSDDFFQADSSLIQIQNK